MSFCIPIVLAEKLKDAAKRGEIDIAEMYAMDSAGRRKLFEKYVDLETAKAINAGFEKAMVSNQKTALKNWAKDTFTGKDLEKGRGKDVLDKISELKEDGLLTPETEQAFLEDLVAQKLGVTVTSEEAKKISDIATRLEKESGDRTEFGTPTLKYFETRKEMEDYLGSINPSSKLKILSSTIARGNLLFRVSSPLLNIESNSVMGAMQAFARRIETRKIGGMNNDYARKYVGFANKVYAKTGYDITRMMDLDSDRLVRGEEQVHSQGPGKIRKIGRFYEDKIFGLTQGAPDVVFSSLAFSDRANIESSKLAENKGLKGDKAKEEALKIFQDATKIDPETKEGRAVRESAVADASYSTYTNKSLYADTALAIRKVFNIATGDLRLGDQIDPFVKTGTNVIGAGINMSGIGVPADAAYRFFKVLQDVHNGEGFNEAAKDRYQGYWKTIVQAGLGVTFAFLLSELFKPDDFIGEWPTSEKERQLLNLRKAQTNSVKIGDRWVSMDYFGPLGAPLTGLLYAKKFGDSLADKVFNYVHGVVRQSARIPGVDQAYSALQALRDAAPGNGKTAQEDIKDMANYMLGFVQSRTIPGILSVLAAMGDNVERISTNGALDKLKLAIPGLRETLPEKKTVFGDTVQTEPWYSTLLFGSRVKTAQDNAIIKELLILDKTGNLPSITDVTKTSPRAKQLKEQIGAEKFGEAMDLFGTKFKENLGKLIQADNYINAPEERKKAAIDKMKNDIFEAVLRKYGYKKPPPEAQTKRTSDAGGKDAITSLAQSVGSVIGNLVPEVSAADDTGKKITSIEVKGDSIITHFVDQNNNPGVSSKNIDDGDSIINSLGGIIERIGTALGLKPKNILGYKTREEKIAEIQKQNDIIQGITDKNGNKGPGFTEPMGQPKGKDPAQTAVKVVKVVPAESKTAATENVPKIEKALEKEGILNDRVLAYTLATVQHETANAFKPVNEGWYNDEKYGYKPGFTGMKQAQKRGYDGGDKYYGRGYIQLTGKENYKRIGDEIGVDLVNKPELANDPEISLKILARFIKDRGVADLATSGDFFGARSGVNGTDKASLIAQTAEKYLQALNP